MRLVLKRNGETVNVIEADPDWALANYPDCEIIEEPLPATPSPVSEPVPVTTRMTKYQFRRRFTLDELVRFDNPELFIQMTPQQRAIANTLQRSFEVATEIDLADPLLHYGMQLMVDWGLLSEERKQQILDQAWHPGG